MAHSLQTWGTKGNIIHKNSFKENKNLGNKDLTHKKEQFYGLTGIEPLNSMDLKSWISIIITILLYFVLSWR